MESLKKRHFGSLRHFNADHVFAEDRVEATVDFMELARLPMPTTPEHRGQGLATRQAVHKAMCIDPVYDDDTRARLKAMGPISDPPYISPLEELLGYRGIDINRPYGGWEKCGTMEYCFFQEAAITVVNL